MAVQKVAVPTPLGKWLGRGRRPTDFADRLILAKDKLF